MGIATKFVVPFLFLVLLLLTPQANSRRLLRRSSSPVESSVQAPAERPRARSPPSACVVVNVNSEDRITARSGKLFSAMLPRRNPVPPSGPSPGINGMND